MYENDTLRSSQLNRFVAEAQKRQQQREKDQSKNDWGAHAVTAIEMKNKYEREIKRRNRRSRIALMSVPPMGIVLAIMFGVILYLYYNAFVPDTTRMSSDGIPSFAKVDDFNRAETFVGRLLNGKIAIEDALPQQTCYEPLMRNMGILLEKFRDATIIKVELDGNCDEIMFKATCKKGKDIALVYLIPCYKRFYISGVEFENTMVTSPSACANTMRHDNSMGGGPVCGLEVSMLSIINWPSAVAACQPTGL